ncbi:hypothetical protein [Parasynechococcus sp.]|uniref:magnesium chelatase subunit ChlI family protein n=1 Tax=Parasynechococcus sp. TaxID=3101203 RepID=UPI00370404F4
MAAVLRQSGAIEAAALELWEQLINQRGLSTRSSLQLLRVARTIADLNDRTSVDRMPWRKRVASTAPICSSNLELSSRGHACPVCPGRAGCRSAGAGDGGR